MASDLLEHVQGYYDALSRGDADQLESMPCSQRHEVATFHVGKDTGASSRA